MELGWELVRFFFFVIVWVDFEGFEKCIIIMSWKIRFKVGIFKVGS